MTKGANLPAFITLPFQAHELQDISPLIDTQIHLLTFTLFLLTTDYGGKVGKEETGKALQATEGRLLTRNNTQNMQQHTKFWCSFYCSF